MNVKAFNMITNKDKTKAIPEHISCDFKCKFNSTTCNSNQKWKNKTCKYEVKTIVSAKKIIFGILANVFVRIAST